MTKVKIPLFAASMLLFEFILSDCNTLATAETAGIDSNTQLKPKMSGFTNQLAWGGHLIAISGCNDCHTPKKMTPMGPVPDMSPALSGHPANVPAPDVNRKEVESKGLGVTNDEIAWVGPLGYFLFGKYNFR